jgi:hypothetical protein
MSVQGKWWSVPGFVETPLPVLGHTVGQRARFEQGQLIVASSVGDIRHILGPLSDRPSPAAVRRQGSSERARGQRVLDPQYQPP